MAKRPDNIYVAGGWGQMSPTHDAEYLRWTKPTDTGDCLIGLGQFGSASDVIDEITDNLGGTLTGGQWKKARHQANAGNGQSVIIFYRENCPAGIVEALVHYSSATGFTQMRGLKVNNIATSSPLIAVNGGNPTGTSLTAGNINTGSETEAFFVMIMADTSGAGISSPTRFTAPPNWILFATDPMNESTCAYGVEDAAGTYNRAIISGRSLSATATAAAAFKTQLGVGSRPVSSVEIATTQSISFNCAKGSPGTTMTFNVPIPPDVNAIAASYDDGSGILAVSGSAAQVANRVSSVPAARWRASTPIVSAGPTMGWFYTEDIPADRNLTVTIVVSSNPTSTTFPFEVTFYGLRNAGQMVASDGGTATLNTTPPVTENNMLDNGVTTRKKNSLILYKSQEESQTVVNITATRGTAIILMPDHNGVYESLESSHDCGAAHVYAGEIGNYNFNNTWAEYEGNSDVVGPWCAQALVWETKEYQTRFLDRTASRDGLLMDGSFDFQRWF